MKRLIALLLFSALLLSGCAQQNAPPIVSEETSAESTAPAHAPTAGGVTVKTDYSAYTPHATQAAKYTRLSDEFLPDLRPSDHYGMLIPFVGSALYLPIDGDMVYTMDGLYGMTDAKGCIVVDAVYSDISPLYTGWSDQTLPFWTLRRFVTAEDGSKQTLCALASFDGSIVTDCIYTEILVGGEGIFLFTEQDGARSFTLLDFSGQELLSSDALPFADRLRYVPYCYAYGEGVLTVCLDDDFAYYYADLQGNLLSGPYLNASAFIGGRGVVMTTEAYALVDRSGNILHEASCEYLMSLPDGRSIADYGDNTCYLLDADGTILLGGSGIQFITQTDCGYVLYYEDYTTAYYDHDCNLLFGGAIPEGWEQIGNSALFCDYRPEGILIKNMLTGAEQLFDAEYFLDLSCGEKTLFCTMSYDADRNRVRIMDDSFQELAKTDRTPECLTDRLTGSSYLVLYQNGSAQFLTPELMPLCSVPAGQSERRPQVFGDRILLNDDRCCAQYDLSGNLLFYYPFLSAMDD